MLSWNVLFQIIDNLVHSSGRRWQALTTDYVNYNDGAGAKVHTGIVGINMFQSYYTRNSGSILTKNHALRANFWSLLHCQFGVKSYFSWEFFTEINAVAITCLLKKWLKNQEHQATIWMSSRISTSIIFRVVKLLQLFKILAHLKEIMQFLGSKSENIFCNGIDFCEKSWCVD